MTEDNRGVAGGRLEDQDAAGAERAEPVAPPETVTDRGLPVDDPAEPASGGTWNTLPDAGERADGEAAAGEPGAGSWSTPQDADEAAERPGGPGRADAGLAGLGLADPGPGDPGARDGEAFPAGDDPADRDAGDRLVAGGFAPPDGPREVPLQDVSPRDMPQPPPPVALDKPLRADGPDDGRPRPGFVPHHDDPRAHGAPYGWQAHHQGPPPGRGPMGPPPAPMGPPQAPMGPPPGAGPRPMGAFGGPPPGGPNWAPVPAPPSSSGGGPGLGLLAAVALIVALVAGAVGAGIGVIATGGEDDGGPVSLGGGTEGDTKVPARPPDSVAGVARRVLPGVVMIKVQGGNGEGGAGTGFIVNGGYILTNNHVVEGAGGNGQIQIVFHDKKTLPATIKGTDPSSDVAVLKPEGQHSLPALQVGDSSKIAVGDPVIAIGSPLGLQGSVTTGIVSSLNRAVPTGGENGGDASVLNAIQTDAAINPGNSGGPLVDGQGRVIGINTAIATLGSRGLGGDTPSGSIGLGFAIPINQGKRVAEEIIRTGSARRAQIGIGMDQTFAGPGVKIAERSQNGIEPIVKGGPAERAGLKPGDVITKLGDHVIDGPADLAAQIRSRAPGEKVVVTYVRGGREATVEVTLAAAN
ncbi:S1C family serine protease [Spirillospora albida]|uniref:S1C family serine protease n=1 Tax=Spirillospora albida TaxID=58123 RepID=UPI00068DE2A8|nr:trypsin-like peptidase domain-containing protein [Spirillospora albida]